ncbi:MAG: PQQ-binding-like beta-propeller repeat protein [Gemmataceae bacterium]|nr:PQQ-binding-like beta-propeller repeat protein [Gemmataceae bacterium]
MWRRDAQRTGSGKEQLAPKLHLQWVREYPRQKTAWLDQPQLLFDRNYEPVVLGSTMFVGSAKNDNLTALDTRTGAEKWVFYTDGPVRFAPAAWDDKVYFVSDDGFLYCLAAETGKLLWKFRGGPADRRLLGNGRLISMWPARGAPVIADGTVYFAASIWPFMGTFLHAVNARTGTAVWTNDGDGSIYMKQPHNADSFAGVAPQGELVVVGDLLIVPGGRSVPAYYDRKTGKMIHYRLNENSKLGGGPEVAALGKLVFNGGAVFELDSGAHLGSFAKQLALADDVIVGVTSAGKLRALDPKTSKLEMTESPDRRGVKMPKFKWSPNEIGSFDPPQKAVESLVRIGYRLYLGSPGQINAVEMPLVKGTTPTVSWKANVDGTPGTMLAADDRLFAVTLEGRIYCFGPERVENPKTFNLKPPPSPVVDAWTKQAKTILDGTKVRDGYCISWGVGSGRLITELLRQSNLSIVAVDPDEEKVLAVRKHLIAAGFYGDRVAVHTGDPMTFPLPQYLASVMVSEDLGKAGIEPGPAFVKKAFASLRPYGGVAWLPVPGDARKGLAGLTDDSSLPNLKIRDLSDAVLLTREGALPGSANWTHEHADPANTRVSRDTIVKAPLGLLWFGGSSNKAVLPRHGHGPQPQVIDGRLIIEGVDMLRAVDIYTGRTLWEANLPGVGKIYNVLPHQPGANATGTNYVSTSDGIYVVHAKGCLRLDPATGKTTKEFRLPTPAGAKAPLSWGYLNVADDYLIAGGDPLVIDPKVDAVSLQLQLWDVAKREKRFTLEGHTDTVMQVAFSADDKLLATASADKSIRLWDVATGKLKKTFPDAHAKRITCLAISPDGKTLASGSEDATIQLWDVSKPKPTAVIKGHTETVLFVAFTNEGKTLASGSVDATVKTWDVATQKLESSLTRLADDVVCMAWAPDGQTVAVGSAGGTLRLWDVASGELRTRADRHLDDLTCLAFSRDSKVLATGSKDKTGRLWDVASGRHLGILQGQLGGVTCLAFAPDGKTLALGTNSALIKLWDLEDRHVIATLAGQPGSARTLAYTADGLTLAMGGTEVVNKTQNESLSSSHELVVLDRKSGKVLWTATAESGFRHNAICIGGGRLYAIDRLSGGEIARMKRRGQTPKVPPRLVVFDLKTGQELWTATDDIFGTWLCYSAKHDVLVEAGRVARDSLNDEPKGMRVYKAEDGWVLWSNKTYSGPAMIHHDMILQGQGACDLLTGKPKMRTDPVTGLPVEWTWTRDYGCNTPAASECLLTFRSGAAGYFDLAGDGGTGNFGGFRSSCTNNLIVAGGLLNAPDYTRDCTCSYQNQASLALVPMADVEVWTRFPVGKNKPGGQDLFRKLFGDQTGPQPVAVRHLALNLGAPGNRRAPDGRMWLNEFEHVQIKHALQYGYYNGHSSKFTSVGNALPWVASGGCRGISWLELLMKEDPDGARYTVRLTFADPDNDKAGQRLFDVKVQGQTVLSNFDIVKEAGARHRGIVREFKGIAIKDRLEVRFLPAESAEPSAANVPLLCGIEVVREDE